MFACDMEKNLRASRVKWFSERQKPKHKSARRTPMQIVALRLNDLARIFRSRYGVTLPDDDAGRDDMLVALHHLACLPRPRPAIMRWIELWAPWMTVAAASEIAGETIASPQRWKADALAWRLRLTKEERRMLGVTTIGAIDENKAARAKRRRMKECERKARIRRAKGAKPRKQYEEQSISQAMPWIEQGISRAQWYRNRKRQ